MDHVELFHALEKEILSVWSLWSNNTSFISGSQYFKLTAIETLTRLMQDSNNNAFTVTLGDKGSSMELT